MYGLGKVINHIDVFLGMLKISLSSSTYPTFFTPSRQLFLFVNRNTSSFKMTQGLPKKR